MYHFVGSEGVSGVSVDINNTELEQGMADSPLTKLVWVSVVDMRLKVVGLLIFVIFLSLTLYL